MNANPGQDYASSGMQGPPPPAITGGPSFAAAYSFDALLARCPQGSWRPDPKTMLFFGNDTFAERLERTSGQFADDPVIGKIVSFIRQGGKRPPMMPASGDIDSDAAP